MKHNILITSCAERLTKKAKRLFAVWLIYGLGALTIKKKTKKENIMTDKEKVVADMLLAAIDKAENTATPGNATDRSRAICDYETFISAAFRRAEIK